MKIPKEWTFRSQEIVAHFDQHVREQLPWYELTTRAIAHIARHYIPVNGIVYDVGASTGNIGKALATTLRERKAEFVAIDDSPEMVKAYKGPGTAVCNDAISYDYKPFDVAVCFLVLMFLPVEARASFVRRLESLLKPGGALVIFDKILPPGGYLGSVVRRLTLSWKHESGTPAGDIIAKELSLGGVQRPIHPRLLGRNSVQVFQFGEFAGWVIEKPE